MEQQTNTAYATRLTNTSELSAYIGKELGLELHLYGMLLLRLELGYKRINTCHQAF